MTQKASAGDTVRIHYIGTLDNGEQFDSSVGSEPLEFILGSGHVIAGFDAAVDGMAVGEIKDVRIPAEEAYGPHREEMVLTIPRTVAPNGWPERGAAGADEPRRTGLHCHRLGDGRR